MTWEMSISIVLILYGLGLIFLSLAIMSTNKAIRLLKDYVTRKRPDLWP